jgi:GNAT superfamily N-acetyltransferase
MSVTIKRTDNTDKDFKMLVSLLDMDLLERYKEKQAEYDKYNKIENLTTVVIAYVNDKPVGCGCFKKFTDDTVEVKRMYVQPEHRKAGIGAAILQELEKWAKEQNFKYAVLETAQKQPEAIHLYHKSGYAVIDNYGQYSHMPMSICLKKSLMPE